MKLLIATENASIIGGRETYLQALIPALVKRGHQIGLVHGDTPERDARTIDPNSLCTRWDFCALGLPETIRQIAAWRPDVRYVQGLVSPALESALAQSYPSVLYCHDYYGTCVTGTKSHAFPMFRPCSRPLGPMCMLLHLPLRCGGLNPVSAVTAFRTQSLKNRTLSRHAAVLVASDHMRTEFISNGVSPERIQTLPYPVIEAVPLENAPSTRAPIGNVLFMGRLTKLKGLDYLFSALVQAQKHLNFPLSLTVAGSGPEEVSLRRTAQRLPFKVNFAGWIDREAKSALLENADLLAVPSVWPEPFGLVGLEAACWGVPSVAFDVGGVSSWLDAGKTGEIAPGTPPKAQELSEAIVRALSNPEHFNRLRRGAWERSQHFNMRDHVARLEAVLISSHEQQAVTP